uniref:Ubiquitin-like domain-containing protein n=1 Tax=Chaetoceros debilis TaxID=122233 RepID=A0A7S3VAG0_9STRA|mmetsp:Transcript_24629/g.37640  ORF Transcript_24629/g.37640 Transcript_24629/m.37640 type:complete len:733 (-) Transcript_24629:25-2223(-)
MSESDSGSDLSDIEASTTLVHRKPAQFKSRAAAALPASPLLHGNGDGNGNGNGKSKGIDSEESESEDDELFRSITNKRKKVEKKNDSDDSDSDNDDNDDGKKAKFAQVPSNLNNKASKAAAAAAAVTAAIELSDSEDERMTVRKSYASLPEHLLRARAAREALAKESSFTVDDNDDDDDDDDILIEQSTAPLFSKPKHDPPLINTMKAAIAIGPVIRLQLRTKITSSPVNHGGKAIDGKSDTFKFRSGTFIQAVMNQYRKTHDSKITSHATVKIMFDGQALNMQKTLAQCDMEDEDLVDVVVSIPAGAPKAGTLAASNKSSQLRNRNGSSASASASVPAEASTATTAQYVKIDTNIKGGDPTKTHTYHLKESDPFEKLMKVYRDKHNYSSIKPVTFEYNGRKVELYQCPKDLGFKAKGAGKITICDEEQRVKQCRLMAPRQDATGSGYGGGLPLKFRSNGCSKSIDTFSISPSSPFKTLMDMYFKKYGLKESNCKFMLDGDVLNPKGTPNGEDLEGGEVIDVTVDKAGLERMKQTISTRGVASAHANTNAITNNGRTSSPASALTPTSTRSTRTSSSNAVPTPSSTRATRAMARQSTRATNQQSTHSAPSRTTRATRSSTKKSATSNIPSSTNNKPSVASSTSTVATLDGPDLILTILVHRNNGVRPKKFKVRSSGIVSRLKEGYVGAYKKKGCKSVTFYLRGVPIEDSKTFGSLNMKEGDKIIAMENGKTL